MKSIAHILLLFFVWACQPVGIKDTETPSERFRRVLTPLHELPAAPTLTDWRTTHPEPAQSFEAYARSQPTGCTEERQAIYVQTLGRFSQDEKKQITEAADYLQCFFQLPVRHLPAADTLSVPEEAQRIHKHTQKLQVRAGFLLDQILLPALPDSAAAFIGFTTWDLYPSEQWNFVFGQANLRRRTGVWSLARFQTGKALRDRTLKTGAHELGHVFSLPHCQDFRCVMAGSNNLRELDSHPMHLCPVCLSKLHYNLKFDPVKRFEDLAVFWKNRGENERATFYYRSAKRLRKN